MMKKNTLILQPREKFLYYGIEVLTDEELFQLLLGTGSKSCSVNILAKKCLSLWDANPLPDQNFWKKLQELIGIGPAKAAQIAAGWELTRRSISPSKMRISTPQDLFPRLLHYCDRPQEVFLTATLNGAQDLIRLRVITMGLLNRTLVHPREVFTEALKDNTASLILAHSHPSGNLEPSKEDLEITQRLLSAGKLLGVEVLDHIIFSKEGYYSFRENSTLFL